MLLEKQLKKMVNGQIKISTNSFFNFGFPQIISKGNSTQDVVIFKGWKKYNLVCLVAFRDAWIEIITIPRNNAEPKDTVYLLSIEAALVPGEVEIDWQFCALICLKSKYFKNILIVIWIIMAAAWSIKVHVELRGPLKKKEKNS